MFNKEKYNEWLIFVKYFSYFSIHLISIFLVGLCFFPIVKIVFGLMFYIEKSQITKEHILTICLALFQSFIGLLAISFLFVGFFQHKNLKEDAEKFKGEVRGKRKEIDNQLDILNKAIATMNKVNYQTVTNNLDKNSNSCEQKPQNDGIKNLQVEFEKSKNNNIN